MRTDQGGRRLDGPPGPAVVLPVAGAPAPPLALRGPGRHADCGCTHGERIIPPVVKGPADKPLRLRRTVNLWDSQPQD
ncbi:hypothetical protein ACPC54_41415 [Kitasatospora sp. NPDC094028]